MRTVIRLRALVTGLVLTTTLSLVGCPDNHFDGGTGGAPSGGGGGGGGAASLTALVLSAGTLNPAFSTGATSYSTMVVNTSSLTVTPTATGGTITVNGVAVVSGSPSGAITLTPGSNTVTVVLTDGSGPQTYTLTVHYLTQEAYIKASNTEAFDSFSTRVALDGDTLAVGVNSEDSNATGINGNQADNSAANSGAVYVFTRTAGVWTQQAYLKASNTGTTDNFGVSVALSGDSLAVGAFGEDSNATGINGNQADNSAADAGAVYVFTRSAGVWTQQAYVKASNTDANDQFGTNVALDGDTLAVSANGEDSNATGVNGNQADNSAADAGAVYVFIRSAGVWTQQAYVKASNTDASDNFGVSVALDGDTLAVSANFEDSNATGVNGSEADNSATSSGAVYVFTRSAGVWTQQAYVKASNTGTNDNFGVSVALSGDSLAVGAYFEDSNATGINGNQADNSAANSGAVYVFTRTAGVWTQQAYVKASNTGASDNFGIRVALSGDTLAVSANSEDSNATGINGNQADNSAANSGAVYVLTY
jgi:hypothetical protein